MTNGDASLLRNYVMSPPMYYDAQPANKLSPRSAPLFKIARNCASLNKATHQQQAILYGIATPHHVPEAD